MTQRILLVDDDVSLLSALNRNLCFDYDVTTVASGQEALDLIASQNGYKVVVTDMRMPRMDGIQFIEEARRAAPDAVFIMLTGNQDVQTAMKAVNDGHVFRFLNKPCEIAEIRRALDAGLRQHQLLQAEKEMLQDTFVGAVNVLTDVLDALRPDVVEQSNRIDAVMRACEVALGFCGNWQYRMAARLSLVGLALQPAAQQARFKQLIPSDPEFGQLLQAATATTARLIERIPRLQDVAAILNYPVTVDTVIAAHRSEQGRPALGAVLLRIATYWTMLIARDDHPLHALQELQQAFPHLPKTIADALIALEGDYALKAREEVAPGSLSEGMVLADDVVSEDGALLLRSGRRLTLAILERLRLSNLGGRSPKRIAVWKSPAPSKDSAERQLAGTDA